MAVRESAPKRLVRALTSPGRNDLTRLSQARCSDLRMVAVSFESMGQQTRHCSRPSYNSRTVTHRRWACQRAEKRATRRRGLTKGCDQIGSLGPLTCPAEVRAGNSGHPIGIRRRRDKQILVSSDQLGALVSRRDKSRTLRGRDHLQAVRCSCVGRRGLLRWLRRLSRVGGRARRS